MALCTLHVAIIFFTAWKLPRIVGRKNVLKSSNEHMLRSPAKSRKVMRSHAESREIPWMYSFFEYIHRNVSLFLHTFTETVTRSHAESPTIAQPTLTMSTCLVLVKWACHHQTPQLKPLNPTNWCPNSCTDNNRLTQGFRKSQPSNELSHQLPLLDQNVHELRLFIYS